MLYYALSNIFPSLVNLPFFAYRTTYIEFSSCYCVLSRTLPYNRDFGIPASYLAELVNRRRVLFVAVSQWVMLN